jgi:hypothetical protein
MSLTRMWTLIDYSNSMFLKSNIKVEKRQTL